MNDAYPLIDAAESRCLMGASFGGVASLHTAWRYPEQFGSLLLQSGSFAFSELGRHQRGPVFDPVVRFMNEFREHSGRPAERIFHELRHVRVTDLRKPLAGAAPAGAGRQRYVSKKRAMRTTGKTGVTGCATACPGCFRARPGWSTTDESGVHYQGNSPVVLINHPC